MYHMNITIYRKRSDVKSGGNLLGDQRLPVGAEAEELVLHGGLGEGAVADVALQPGGGPSRERVADLGVVPQSLELRVLDQPVEGRVIEGVCEVGEGSGDGDDRMPWRIVRSLRCTVARWASMRGRRTGLAAVMRVRPLSLMGRPHRAAALR
jgi:hypothetical protein